MFEQIWQERAAANPAKRYGDPKELGAYCAFLCSMDAGYITGQNLVIDAGTTQGLTSSWKGKTPMKHLLSAVLVAIACVLIPQSALAQAYPSRTITVVVPFPAGGSVDGVARILVPKLNQVPGWSAIVENRAGGAGGTVGANTVAKAASDGYALMLTA